MSTATTPVKTEAFACPTHGTPLLYVLKGGAGYCSHPLHRMYVQAAGIEPPELDAVIVAKRAAASKPKAKKAKKAKREARQVHTGATKVSGIYKYFPQ